MTKQLKLTLVEGAGPASDSGLWNHPDYATNLFKDITYWEDLARTLERAGFDAIFFADTPAIRADTPQARAHALRSGGLPRLDPAYLIPILAAVTERLGFVITSSITYDHPVALARKFTTLDHLTGGRIGWNVVATNVRSAALNHGLTEQLPHDTRYDRGDEFLDVAYQLWNGAWDDDAVVRSPERGIYVDPGKVRAVEHEGEWFRVRGVPISEPSPQRTPVLFQAGSSDRGRQFAATHAEAIYLNANTVAETAFLVSDVRARAAALGRDPAALKFLPRIIPVVGATQAEAEAKLEDYVARSNPESAIVTLQQWAGIDLRGRDPEEELDLADLQVKGINSEHAADYLRRSARSGERFTVGDLIRMYAFTGGAGNVVAGTPGQIADTMERWVREADVDGFNIAYMLRRHSIAEFAEQVVPELRRRGLLAPEGAAAGPTLRERLTGAGPQVPEDHPAARSRTRREAPAG
jgi:FMN-dependent oxidoreductase (nitrilotriacetate monooxygenase family)